MARYIVGIDEAGRGPLAGPVTVGFMACPAALAPKIFADIRDSKKLSAKRREEWFSRFKNTPLLCFGAASVSHTVIDKKGISAAIRLALVRCLSSLSFRYKLQATSYTLFLDGGLHAPPEFRQKTVIKGDEKVPIIAAASIVAKVRRDRMMVRLAKKFPHYGFEIHKGYGTRFHCEQIKTNGLSSIHRKTFCRKFVLNSRTNVKPSRVRHCKKGIYN